LLAGKLRIGLAEQSLLIALAQASAEVHKGKKPSGNTEFPEDIIKQVYNSMPNYNILIPALMLHGIYNLPNYCGMRPGIPLKPMLAFPTKSISEVLDRFESIPFTCEYKYDGERAQIHILENGKIEIFSRNNEDATQKYPDIAELIPQIIKTEKVKDAVLDCEVVAWDSIGHKLLPFQILTTRKRKDVTSESIQVQVRI
jgi:DNA ligase-1